jgi:hypothetical protein
VKGFVSEHGNPHLMEAPTSATRPGPA